MEKYNELTGFKDRRQRPIRVGDVLAYDENDIASIMGVVQWDSRFNTFYIKGIEGDEPLDILSPDLFVVAMVYNKTEE